MQTAQYFYQGQPVEIQGTNAKRAYIEFDGIIVPIAFNVLRESHEPYQASRFRDREGRNTNESQEARQEVQKDEEKQEE